MGASTHHCKELSTFWGEVGSSERGKGVFRGFSRDVLVESGHCLDDQLRNLGFSSGEMESFSYFFLYPTGQAGLIAVTVLDNFPLTQVMVVFLIAAAFAASAACFAARASAAALSATAFA